MIDTEEKIKIAQWLIDPENHQELPTDLRSLKKKLDQLELGKIYRTVEIPLHPILQTMHEVGISVDLGYLKKIDSELTKEIDFLMKKIYKLAGGAFNLNSPKQLSAVLFEKLKIDKSGIKKTKSGSYSTDIDALKELSTKHDIISQLTDYREFWKILSTYVRPLLKLADKKGRVHTTFVQTGTSTGRLSSQNPNLQNVPAVGEWGGKLRRAFIAEKGFSFLAADYSQIELRVLASVAADEKMIAAFRKKLDIHQLTASQVFNVPLPKVTAEMRRIAKTLNFGVIYGMGPDAFGRTSGLSREEAEKFIAEYFADFAQVKIWQRETIEKARAFGYVNNLNGRKRHLPEINEPERFRQAAAERAAINMPIQSLAADIIKLAMIKVTDLIREQRVSEKTRLLLSIHDELLFEIHDDILEKMATLLKNAMEKVYVLKVPLVVEMKKGKNWGEMSPFLKND